MAQSASSPNNVQPQQPAVNKASRLSVDRSYARSIPGVLRAAQLFASAAAWMCVACTRYRGALHFVMFVAVTAWLLTLAAYAMPLLGLGLARKQQDRSGGGGGHYQLGWLGCNACADFVLAWLCVAACVVAAHMAREHSFCDVAGYRSSCPHRAYVAAAVFCGICALLYAASSLLHGIKWRQLRCQQQGSERPAAHA